MYLEQKISFIYHFTKHCKFKELYKLLFQRNLTQIVESSWILMMHQLIAAFVTQFFVVWRYELKNVTKISQLGRNLEFSEIPFDWANRNAAAYKSRLAVIMIKLPWQPESWKVVQNYQIRWICMIKRPFSLVDIFHEIADKFKILCMKFFKFSRNVNLWMYIKTFHQQICI